MKPWRGVTLCVVAGMLFFVTMSSSSVFGNTEDPYVEEDIEPAPIVADCCNRSD